ncbi:MAG: class I SAM-dependent methyltransferase [Betaproteobacteria bacterium]|nr:class I SAM-dependent methyltransferase [Betaproteobacteria bacterium]
MRISPSRIFSRLFLLCAALAASAAMPVRAQDDNFTPFVISADEVVHRMLRMADIGPRDYLIDLGSGDGRIPIAAARQYGARGLGVDLDPDLVTLARRNAEREGVAGKVGFEVRDLFDTDLSQASVVAFYLLPNVTEQLRPKLLLELKPGARIVAHDYDLGEWLPDEWTAIRVPDKPVAPVGESRVFLWVVPGDARGRWESRIEGRQWRFEIEQRYQMVKVRATLDGAPAEVRAARLRGDELRIVAYAADGTHRFAARIAGGRMQGTLETGGTREPRRSAWSAVREP